jgi:hypothetical protein
MSNPVSTMSSSEEVSLALSKIFQEFETITAKTPLSKRMMTTMRLGAVMAAVQENPKLVTREVMASIPEDHLGTCLMIILAFFAQQMADEAKAAQR